MNEGIRKTKRDPKESKTPSALTALIFPLRKVVSTPTRKPIKRAGKGFGKTLELDP